MAASMANAGLARIVIIIAFCITKITVVATYLSASQNTGSVHLIGPDSRQFSFVGLGKDVLEIFCHDSKWQPFVARSFKSFTTTQARITSPLGDDFAYQVYVGNNESHVREKHEESQGLPWVSSLWSLPWQSDVIFLTPFNKTCFGIYTKDPYSVNFVVKVFNLFLVACFIVGLVLFLSAKNLSGNIVFYYGTGVSIGVFASLLIVVYILSRFVPFKKGAYVVFIGGWSVVLFVLQYLWEHSYSILENHYHYVLGYFLSAGLISFAVCYWKGPVTNQRTLDLIKWTIQLLGLVLIYNSIQVAEVAVSIIVALLIIYNVNVPIPRITIHWVSHHWKRRFPSKRKLITDEEFRKEGLQETKKALEELRQFCRSPDCDAWRVIGRMNTPQRFAKFVEGDRHLSEDEMTFYEEDLNSTPPQISDDEDDIDFRLYSQ